LDVEAPGRQDAEAQEYQAYFELPQRSRTGWIDVQNVKLFLSGPSAPNRQVLTVVLCLPPAIQLQSRIQARTVVELSLQLTGFKTRAGDP